MNGRILNLNICSSFDLTTFLPYVFIPSTQESFLGLFTAFWLVFSSPLFEIVQGSSNLIPTPPLIINNNDSKWRGHCICFLRLPIDSIFVYTLKRVLWPVSWTN